MNTPADLSAGCKVYAFEWCGCIFESGFSTVSLHTTKRGAFQAMTRAANERWQEARNNVMMFRKGGYNPLEYEAWRVVTIEVLGDKL